MCVLSLRNCTGHPMTRHFCFIEANVYIVCLNVEWVESCIQFYTPTQIASLPQLCCFVSWKCAHICHEGIKEPLIQAVWSTTPLSSHRLPWWAVVKNHWDLYLRWLDINLATSLTQSEHNWSSGLKSEFVKPVLFPADVLWILNKETSLNWAHVCSNFVLTVTLMCRAYQIFTISCPNHGLLAKYVIILY